MDTVIHPGAKDMGQALGSYCKGLMFVSDDNNQKYWARLLHVDEFQGIFVSAYMREGGNFVVRADPRGSGGIIFSVKGIMVFDRGGVFEIFGSLTKDEEGNLVQVFTPFDKQGQPCKGEASVTNTFYVAESLKIPEGVRSLFGN